MKYVALLRGINVGGRIIKMADLVACLEAAELSNVVTILQSGNVLFDAEDSDLKSKLETTLSKKFNYPARVQVLEVSELKNIVSNYPFDSHNDTKQHYVIFMENGLETDLSNNSETDRRIEQTAAGDGVVYWQVQKGMTLKSMFSKYLTKAKYKDYNTNRNLKTLNKILLAHKET